MLLKNYSSSDFVTFHILRNNLAAKVVGSAEEETLRRQAYVMPARAGGTNIVAPTESRIGRACKINPRPSERANLFRNTSIGIYLATRKEGSSGTDGRTAGRKQHASGGKNWIWPIDGRPAVRPPVYVHVC